MKPQKEMTTDEGVTKFELAFEPSAALPAHQLRALIAWRADLWRRGLIGQNDARYGGAGFGNVSQRLLSSTDVAEPRFAISGTQTGALARIDARHFAIVTASFPERNRIEAEGPIAPSSESLTHAMLYRLKPTIRFVFHVHSPDIWRRARGLRLPCTADDVAYGTPAMALEMQRLLRAGVLAHRRLLVMGGHEDGVIAFGRTADQAGAALLQTLAAAKSF